MENKQQFLEMASPRGVTFASGISRLAEIGKEKQPHLSQAQFSALSHGNPMKAAAHGADSEQQKDTHT